MSRQLVFSVYDVEAFSPKGQEGVFTSAMLIDKESVGSQRLVVNRFIVKSGKKTEPGIHADPYDEFYYVLRGKGLLLLGNPEDEIEIAPDMVAFIPSGTWHHLENRASEDLVILTVMPAQLVEGVNPVYDERRRTWGTTFRLRTLRKKAT